MTIIHASCVAFGEIGVLVRGQPGSGKSSLCLSLIDGSGFGLGQTLMRAVLVADDQVEIASEAGRILASPPAALAGKLEIRGLGIVNLGFKQRVTIGLVVDLTPTAEIGRLPEPHDLLTDIASITLPRFMLDAKTPTAPTQIRAALGHFGLL